jgi:hypothetical protein
MGRRWTTCFAAVLVCGVFAPPTGLRAALQDAAQAERLPPRAGHVEADADGVATVPGLEVPQDSPGLTVRITRAP